MKANYHFFLLLKPTLTKFFPYIKSMMGYFLNKKKKKSTTGKTLKIQNLWHFTVAFNGQQEH